MSSSCHRWVHRRTLAGVSGAIGLQMIALTPIASAQEWYFVPRVEVGTEYHTNRELTPDPALEDPMIQYRGTFEAKTGRRTPRSDTEFRPRILLQEFPDRNGIDPIELFFDIDHEFHTQRSEFLLFARYSRQDSFNAEYGDANFDPFNPQDPNAGDTGITYIGDTRGRITVEPDYSFAISETSRIGTTVRYDNVNYYHNDDRPPGTVGLVGYDAGSLKVYFGKSFGPQFDFKIGPYVARYEADNNSNTTDNYGLSLEGKYTWSEIWETGLAITAEHSESTQPNSIPTEETNTNWGLEFYGLRKGQTDTLRYSIGHFIEPSTAASMIETSQLRVQYDHIFTPRLIFNGAVRVKESSRLGASSGSSSDFARAEVSLRWRLTQQWYINGGYRFAWSDPSGGGSGDTATDNAVFMGVGYLGLDPRNR